MKYDKQLPPWPEYGSFDPNKVIRRRSEIAVGSVVFVYDQNRRVYGSSLSGPSPRHHYRAEQVVGETSRSWLTGYAHRPDKHPKADPRALHGLDDVEDALWVSSHRYRISRKIDAISDADKLRAIAKLIGFEPEPSPNPEDKP